MTFDLWYAKHYPLYAAEYNRSDEDRDPEFPVDVAAHRYGYLDCWTAAQSATGLLDLAHRALLPKSGGVR